MTSIRAPLCLWCRHYRRGGRGRSCAAYPERIPDAILIEQSDLHLALRGDEAEPVVFNLMSDAEQTRAFGKPVPLNPDRVAALRERTSEEASPNEFDPTSSRCPSSATGSRVVSNDDGDTIGYTSA